MNKIDLPMYREEMGPVSRYNEDSYNYRWVSSCCKLVQFLPKYNYDNRTVVGYVVDEYKTKTRELEWRLEYVQRYGAHYEFRRSPVRSTGCYQNSIRYNRSNGIKKEMTDDQKCHKRYVRAKRQAVVWRLMDWDGYSNYNSQRGWKRSKKAKQYL